MQTRAMFLLCTCRASVAQLEGKELRGSPASFAHRFSVRAPRRRGVVESNFFVCFSFFGEKARAKHLRHTMVRCKCSQQTCGVSALFFRCSENPSSFFDRGLLHSSSTNGTRWGRTRSSPTMRTRRRARSTRVLRKRTRCAAHMRLSCVSYSAFG